MIRGRRLGAVVTASVAALLPLACGDGAPAFCTSLEQVADLDTLADALDGDDLRAAAAEARRLRDLSADAPPEIRGDFRALAAAVVDIVDLLRDEQRVASAGDGDGGASAPGPAEVERRREQLNDQLGELDRRSLRVATWASRECGIDLT